LQKRVVLNTIPCHIMTVLNLNDHNITTFRGATMIATHGSPLFCWEIERGKDCWESKSSLIFCDTQ
jgi:hypothetical protein